MLNNEYSLAKIGVDEAENGPKIKYEVINELLALLGFSPTNLRSIILLHCRN